MKSIKEKVEEYADEQDLRMAYNGSCDNCRQGFVLSANYVLEQIEKQLDEFFNFEDSIIVRRVIEQLKK